ncbi:hypothetical protein Dimus_018321, partial [Dionaea muscipula]
DGSLPTILEDFDTFTDPEVTPLPSAPNQPSSTIAEAPSSTVADLPNSTMAELPDSPTFVLPNSTMDELPNSPTVVLPNSTMAELPNSSIVEPSNSITLVPPPCLVYTHRPRVETTSIGPLIDTA